MRPTNDIGNRIPFAAGNPFRVPEKYFDLLRDDINQKITAEPLRESNQSGRRHLLRPILAVAASLSGLALIISVVVQSLSGNKINDNGYLDLAIFEETGLYLDESLIIETFSMMDDESYTEWEKAAMTYLASNEVDLLSLLESN